MEDHKIKDNKRILIIEDNEGIRTLYSEVLHDEGYEVECADGGSEGLKKAINSFFDLIILDLMMPEMDGLQVLDGLRSAGVKSKVVLFTNLYIANTVEEAKKKGVDAFIVKSDTDPGKLIEKIKSLIN